jgi:hypothetical protein
MSLSAFALRDALPPGANLKQDIFRQDSLN